jgi:hypothetical protein
MSLYGKYPQSGSSGQYPPVNPFDDLEALRRDTDEWRESQATIPTTEVETEPQKRHRRGFIRGPFPLPEFHAAARLPGKALAVWLFANHRVRMTRKAEVTLPNTLLEAGGVDRNAKARALREQPSPARRRSSALRASLETAFSRATTLLGIASAQGAVTGAVSAGELCREEGAAVSSIKDIRLCPSL